MKIYLSSYWRKNSIFMVALTVIDVVVIAAFCIYYEDYISIIVALLYIILFSCLQVSTLKLLDYVEVKNNQFVMRSVSGRRRCTINSNSLIYYQIVLLIEGTFSKTDFIVLSNQAFPRYQKGKGLAKVCKEVNAQGNQIIMPYNKMSKELFNLKNWHRIS